MIYNSVTLTVQDWYVRTSGLRYTGLRAISAIAQGGVPGPENSIGKIVAGNVHTTCSASKEVAIPPCSAYTRTRSTPSCMPSTLTP